MPHKFRAYDDSQLELDLEMAIADTPTRWVVFDGVSEPSVFDTEDEAEAYAAMMSAVSNTYDYDIVPSLILS